MNIHWIHCIENFSPFSIFEQLALALKNKVFPENFHCIDYILFIIQDFWATWACPEKQSFPWNSSLYWSILIIQDFWATHACLVKQSVPWIDLLNAYFYHSGFLSNLRLHWKTELPWNFSLFWNIFYYSGILSNLRLPWKQNLPWNFSSRGTAAPPASYAYEPMV